MKKTQRRPGGFWKWNRSDSDVLCACGCGEFISNRTAKNKAKGKTEGYRKGHCPLGEDGRKKITEATKGVPRPCMNGERNPNFGKGLWGEDNPNWQGGKKVNGYINGNPPKRNRKRDRELSRFIRERDGKCVLCGSTSRLHAHHIETWMEREDLRYDENNMVSLCIHCHTLADNAHHRERIKPILETYINELYGR